MKVSRIIGEVQNEIHRVVDVAWISHGKDRELLFDGVTVGYVTEGSPNGRKYQFLAHTNSLEKLHTGTSCELSDACYACFSKALELSCATEQDKLYMTKFAGSFER